MDIHTFQPSKSSVIVALCEIEKRRQLRLYAESPDNRAGTDKAKASPVVLPNSMKSTDIRQRYREIAPHFTRHQTRGGRIWKMKKLSRSQKILVSIYVLARFNFAYNRIENEASINLLAACFCWFVLHILNVEWRQIAALHIIFWCMFSPDHLGCRMGGLLVFGVELAEWAWNKTPWYIQLFNISCYAAAAQIAGQFFRRSPGGARLLETILAIVAGMAVLRSQPFSVASSYAGARRNFKESGIFDRSRSLLLTMLSVGACMAIVWEYNPFALSFLILISPYMSLKSRRWNAKPRRTKTGCSITNISWSK